MATSNNTQQSQPGPVAQQLTKLQSNGHQTPPNGQPPKKASNRTGFSGRTLWDWIQFFAVLALPIIVAAGTLYFTQQITLQQAQASEKQHQTDIEIAMDQQRESVLETYLDRMSDLLLNYKLHVSKSGDEVRNVARDRTLTALRELDPDRKGIMLRFLYHADLIRTKKDEETIVVLYSADLTKANLCEGYLPNADISLANLSGACLYRTLLNDAVLIGTNLSGADLRGVYLNRAYLSGAVMVAANLSKAYLDKANLNEADLTQANLSGTDVTPEQLTYAYSLKDTILPDGSTFPSKTWPIPGRNGNCVYMLNDGACLSRIPSP